jgi:HAD superfamily hydrolase (TIGR01509 family)
MKQVMPGTYMNLRSKSFWIFDLDGTLTLPVHDFEYIRSELAIPAIADILGYLDSLPKDEASWRYIRLQEIEIQLAYQAKPAHGALDAVSKLHQSGAQLGILTRNDRDIAMLTLKTIGMGHYFADENVLGRSEAPPKPDPAGIHRLLSEWGAAPSEAVMVGDYLFDLQAGRSAGTTTVHVGRPDGKAWLEYTDYSVTTMDEMLEL